MQLQKVILQLFYITILSFSVALNLKAQSSFPEGILVYKADTIKRIEVFPAAYIISQVVVYKKLDQLRIEVLRVNKFNKTDTQKDINIRNKKGIYIFVESSDSAITVATNFAIYMSYEDEKLHEVERIMKGYASNYKIDKVLKNIIWLNLPAQRVLLKGGPNNKESEMVVTNSIDIPLGSTLGFYVSKLAGTPLQFVVHERGWITRLTADKLRLEKVSDMLFQVDPKREILSLD